MPPESAVSLNWRSSAHWGGGTRRPCRHCSGPAFLRDEHGVPAHKVCAERAQAQAHARVTSALDWGLTA